MNLDEQYLEVIKSLSSLQDRLAKALDDFVSLASINVSGHTFVPSQRKLYLQFQDWPTEVPPIPPAAWIQPRKGVISITGDDWKYVFHGNGMTFTHYSTSEEVGIEFGNNGQNAFTPWIVQVYIETSPTILSYRDKLLKENDLLFDSLLNKGVVVFVDPWLPGSDETFVLKPIM